MNPVKFEGAVIINKPADMTDEQCMAVWAKFGFGKLHQIIKIKEGGIECPVPPLIAGIDVQDFPYYQTAWKPSYEDLQALNNGGSIHIRMIGKQLVPMAVFTIDENGNCNDAG